VIPYFPPVAIPIPGIDQRLDLWLIMVVLGIAGGTEFSRARAIRRGLSVQVTVDCTLFMVAMGFVVAHIVHVAVYNPHLMEEDWKKILPIYGGYSSIGGFLGAAIAIPLFLVAWKKAPPWPYADNLCLGFLLGWTSGRTGCFTAHDHIGAKSDFFLAVDFPERLGGPRHDLGLYEALISGALFLALFLMDRRKPLWHGFISGVACVVYGLTRVGLDVLRGRDLETISRTSDVRWLGLTPAQYGSLALAAFGVYVLVTRRGKFDDISQEAARDFRDGRPPASPAPVHVAPGSAGAPEPPPSGPASGGTPST
jgi:phosphatidylglycerol:prolipoprotein diacylglycerol transferase